MNLEYLINKEVKPTDNNYNVYSYKLLNDTFFKVMDEHTEKIIDICWSYKVN